MNLGLLLLFNALFLLVFSFWFAQIKRKQKDLEEEILKKDIELKEANKKYGGAIDLEKLIKDLNDKANDIEGYSNRLLEQNRLLEAQKQNLEKDIDLLSDENNLLEFGYYQFKYDYEKSEQYNDKLQRIKQLQKDTIKSNNAVVCDTEWEVEGSKVKGRTLTNNIIKLAIRAFNGEADACIAKVKYNNVNVMEARIKKSYDSINKMISYFHCRILSGYLNYKLQELYLTYEYHKKLEEEKEEQRRIKEQMREEEKAQRELERAKLEAEKEEERTRKALQKAEEKLKMVHGEELEKLNSQIELLKKQLEEAQSMRERATSMAQLTKSGYVYVISNIGSFGENVYKIGMTRRLEPMDRVRELGDASVPFNFDVHAMIFSDNAPALETALHKEFYNNRVNKINDRREFFRVDLEKIREVAQKYKADVKFTMIAEAEQYRQTLAIEKEMKARKVN